MTLENLTKKLLAGSALVAASASLPQKSDAQVVPYMGIDTSISTGNYDLDMVNPGDENKFTYTITNFGDGNQTNNPDGSAYNLISFTVPAGSNQGVFNYSTPGGSWTGNIGSDATTFTGNGSSIGSGNTGQFELWADDATPTGIVQSTAIADGTGIDPNQPFRDYDNGNLSSNQYVSVTAPIPEPNQGALLLALGAGALAGLQRRHSRRKE